MNEKIKAHKTKTKINRKRFEDWCKRQKPPLGVDRGRTGYIEWATVFAWAGWKAAMREVRRQQS